MKSNGNSTLSVMIIDADEDLRLLLTLWVRRTPGFECSGNYADAGSAWAAMLRTIPDLVVMDPSLPGLSGITCIRQIKARWPKVGVLAITGSPTDQVFFEALRVGVNGFHQASVTAGRRRGSCWKCTFEARHFIENRTCSRFICDESMLSGPIEQSYL